jgi:hypothetical protein
MYLSFYSLNYLFTSDISVKADPQHIVIQGSVVASLPPAAGNSP